MYEHFVIVSSAFSYGKRIAWHYSDTKLSVEKLQEVRKRSKEVLGKPPFSIHRFSTTEPTWDSVVRMDSFFGEHELIEDLECFLALIKKDKTVSALDIARYLMAFETLTKYELQTKVCEAYRRYWEETGDKLFKEEIVDLPCGVGVREIENFNLEQKEHFRPIMLARIMNAKNWNIIIRILEAV